MLFHVYSSVCAFVQAGVYVRKDGGAGACVCSCAGVNMETSDRRVRRRSDGPSEGVAKPLVLKTLNFPAVVTR